MEDSKRSALAGLWAAALALPLAAQTPWQWSSSGAKAAKRVDLVTDVGRFTPAHRAIDFEGVPVGTSVAPYRASHGVRIELADGSAPFTWIDAFPRVGAVQSFVGGTTLVDSAAHVVQTDPDLWPQPMPALGTPGLLTELPSAAALRIRFDRVQSRAGFEVRSVDPEGATLVVTALRFGAPLGSVYSSCHDAFTFVGLESSWVFDEVRVDLVNPGTGTLSVDNLAYERDTFDGDRDGVPDFIDGCPAIWDPMQEDRDGDRIGDPCDPWPDDPENDVDGDGLPAELDNCPYAFNPTQVDTDFDGLGDDCDPLPLAIDTDGDGIEDPLDNCPLVYNTGQEDCDADGVGDVCDPSLVTPEAPSLALAPGETGVIATQICLPPQPQVVDVLFAVDTTGSMAGEINNLKAVLVSVLNTIQATTAGDLNVGLVSFRDYDKSYSSCGYSNSYGGFGDYPYRVENPMTSGNEIQAAVNSLTATGGSDGPESYVRVLWEVSQPDSGIGFRTGSARFVVLVGDADPHDCDLTESLNKPCSGLTTTTGIDPGRDEMLFTADDLDLQTDGLEPLRQSYLRVLTVYSGSSADYCAWQQWSNYVYGNAVAINSNGTVPAGVNLPRMIGNLIGDTFDFPDLGMRPVETVSSQLQLAFNPPFVNGPLGAFGGTIPIQVSVTVPAGVPSGTVLTSVVHFVTGGVILGKQTIDVAVQ